MSSGLSRINHNRAHKTNVISFILADTDAKCFSRSAPIPLVLGCLENGSMSYDSWVTYFLTLHLNKSHPHLWYGSKSKPGHKVCSGILLSYILCV